MTADELRSFVGRWGLTVGALADLVQVADTRLVRRWISGQVPIPLELAEWLADFDRTMQRRPIPQRMWFSRPAA